jgi:DNA-cytosine methyltransferase
MFDGMSCGQIALRELGIIPDTYYSSEIDPYAQSVTRYNFPNTVFLGDVTGVDFEALPVVNLLMAGSPCQDLSRAKANGKGLEGERSNLFYKFVEALTILRKKNPNIKFLLENVRMKQEWENVISDLLGVTPVRLNSSKFSAQNRLRLYWTNLEVEPSPASCDIVLQDVLENDVTSLKIADIVGDQGKRLIKANIKKSHSLMARDYKGFGNQGMTGVRCIQVGVADLKGRDSIKRVYSPQGKSPTLTTCGGGHREPKVAISPLKWRKLLPMECERLQTVPDNYTSRGIREDGKEVPISNTQRYKMLGNGWTVATVKHILKSLYKEDA